MFMVTVITVQPVTVSIHSVHLMYTEQCQVATDPQTKLTDLSHKSICRLLSSTSIIPIYYYSDQKLTLILPSIMIYSCDDDGNDYY